jgi:hypothetical protein
MKSDFRGRATLLASVAGQKKAPRMRGFGLSGTWLVFAFVSIPGISSYSQFFLLLLTTRQRTVAWACAVRFSDFYGS